MTSIAPRLGYDVVGSGPPILLLPGLTFSRRSWDPVVDRLATDFRCVPVDLPGQGTSPGPACSLSELTTVVHDLARSVAPERPFLVGQGMSAVTALLYAEAFPVAGLVHVDQPLDVATLARMAQSMAATLRGDDFERAFEPVRRSMGVEELPEPQRTATRAHQVVSQQAVLGYWDELFWTTPDELQDRTDRALEAVADRMPMLAVFGRELDEAEHAHWARLAPRAEMVEWPGRGPLVHLATPGRFATRVARFARGTGAR